MLIMLSVGVSGWLSGGGSTVDFAIKSVVDFLQGEADEAVDEV